jgi:hypothetical protein
VPVAGSRPLQGPEPEVRSTSAAPPEGPGSDLGAPVGWGLESYVALLRRALQPGVPGRATVLCTTPGGYRFDTERVRIDLHDFEERIRRAGHTAPAQALPFWESAVSVADGTLLATEPYAAWAVDARRAHERALHAAAAAGAEIHPGALRRRSRRSRRVTQPHAVPHSMIP